MAKRDYYRARERLQRVASNGVKILAANRLHQAQFAHTLATNADDIARAVLDNLREQYRIQRKELLR